MRPKRSIQKYYRIKNSKDLNPSLRDNNAICSGDDGNVICGKCVSQFKITKRDRITFAIQPNKPPNSTPSNKPQKSPKKKGR